MFHAWSVNGYVHRVHHGNEYFQYLFIYFSLFEREIYKFHFILKEIGLAGKEWVSARS